MACLTVMDGPLKGQQTVLNHSVTRIGRRDENDWVLQDGSVSGIHCEIEKSATGIIIRDLGSTNGTKVNSEPIREKRLYRNDIILVGEIPLMIDGDDIAQSELPEPYSIPRTTIVIQQKRTLEPPKEFSKKSNSNKIWGALIAVLLLVIIGLLVKLFTGE